MIGERLSPGVSSETHSASTALNPPTPGLARSSVQLLTADLAVGIATLISAPILLRKLGPETYGIVAMTNLLVTQLAVLQLGLLPALVRRLAEHRGGRRPSAEAATVRAGWILGLAAAISTGVVFSYLARWAWRDVLTPTGAVGREAVLAVPAAAVLAGLQPLIGVAFGTLWGTEALGRLSAFRATHGMARALLPVIAVLSGGGVAGIFLTQAIADAAVVLIRWMGTRSPAVPHSTLDWTAGIRGLVALGLPFAAIGVMDGLLADGEKLTIGLVRPLADLSFYTIPFNALFRLAAFQNALLGALSPRIARLMAARRNDEVVAVAGRSIRVITGFLLPAMVLLSATAPEWLALWLGPEFAARSTSCTRWLSVALLASACAQVPNAVLRSGGPPSILVLSYLIELPFYLAMVAALVGKLGIVGAALAWTLRMTAHVFIQPWLCRRLLATRIESALPSFAGIAVLMLMVGLMEWLGPSLGLRLLAAGIVALAALRIYVRPEDWRTLRGILP